MKIVVASNNQLSPLQWESFFSVGAAGLIEGKLCYCGYNGINKKQGMELIRVLENEIRSVMQCSG